MSERIALFRNEPEDVYARALELGPFVRRVCLFSGGKDSLAVALRCREMYDELVHIDTGTAIPGVREHVERCADWLGKPLRVYETPPEVYDEIVVRMKGFPGPAQHNRCYNRLKERRLRDLVRELKEGDHRARVLALSGSRRSESSRRAKRQEITRSWALVCWCWRLSTSSRFRDERLSRLLPPRFRVKSSPSAWRSCWGSAEARASACPDSCRRG